MRSSSMCSGPRCSKRRRPWRSRRSGPRRALGRLHDTVERHELGERELSRGKSLSLYGYLGRRVFNHYVEYYGTSACAPAIFKVLVVLTEVLEQRMGLYPVIAWAVRGNVPIKAIGEERLTAEPSPKQCREHCPSARRFGRSDLARVSAVRIPFIGRRVYGKVSYVKGADTSLQVCGGVVAAEELFRIFS